MTCDCDARKDAQEMGSDSEGFGPLLYAPKHVWADGLRTNSTDEWRTGSDLPPVTYCPWCGKHLPPVEREPDRPIDPWTGNPVERKG